MAHDENVPNNHDVTMYKCELCAKTYKTKNGLTRHHKAKHVDIPLKLSFEDFEVLLSKTIKKLSEDLNFLKSRMEEFENLKLVKDEITIVWKKFSPVFESFSGCAEKYYHKMFKFALPSADQVFLRISRLASNLLVTELTTSCLEHLTTSNDTSPAPKVFQWDEKSLFVVQYLAGFCFGTIYTRLHRSKKRYSPAIQQLILLLKSAKLDSNSELAKQQILVNIKDRGGLWAVKRAAVRIFEICEEEFFLATQGFKRSIAIDKMVGKLERDLTIKSKFRELCRQCDAYVESEYSKNLLFKLIQLYLRVRSHSNAKAIKEKAKAESKQSRKKSLRAALKRAEADDCK